MRTLAILLFPLAAAVCAPAPQPAPAPDEGRQPPQRVRPEPKPEVPVPVSDTVESCRVAAPTAVRGGAATAPRARE